MSYEDLVDLIDGYFGIDPFEGGKRPSKEELIQILRSHAS